MSNRSLSIARPPQAGRTIHPRALEELGAEACIVALGVVRDLRSGVIAPHDFNMEQYCGTSCCIAGHIALRLCTRQCEYLLLARDSLFEDNTGLFSGLHPSDPKLAADAIERYVYDGSEDPWKVPAAV